MKIELTTGQLRMLAAAKGAIWAIGDDHLESFALACLSAEEVAEIDDTRFNVRGDSAIVNGRKRRYGVINIKGGLMHKAPDYYEAAGFITNYETITRELSELSGNVDTVVLHIDSPGGMVMGLSEAADSINEFPGEVIAYTDGLCCSAAYYLASQADIVVASNSAIVGNIGAITRWVDCSGFWSSMGIEFKALTSEGADLKSTFHLEPNETQIEFLQESINEAGAQFRRAVESGRAGVDLDSEIWRAGWYSGEKALSLGLIDEIASPQAFIAEIGG